jgi:hypothetical protein
VKERIPNYKLPKAHFSLGSADMSSVSRCPIINILILLYVWCRCIYTKTMKSAGKICIPKDEMFLFPRYMEFSICPCDFDGHFHGLKCLVAQIRLFKPSTIHKNDGWMWKRLLVFKGLNCQSLLFYSTPTLCVYFIKTMII